MREHAADVSVVIPTYNRSALLRETIESVLAQTLPPREIIVVDNGTTDDTAAMVRRFGDRIVYLRTAPLGVQAARNAGIATASSSWVSLLDDDDLYRPDFFAEVAPAIADGRADLVFTDHRKFSSEGPRALTNFETAPPDYFDGLPRPEAGSRHSFVGTFPVERLLAFIGFYPSTLVARKTLLDRLGGYDPGVQGMRSEDIEFLARALPVARVALVWRPLVDYRIHASNDSGIGVAGRLAQIGKLRVLEYVAEKDAHGSAALREALRHDLPRRRVAMFDAARDLQQFGDVRRIGGMLRPSDWTRRRRAAFALAALPTPLAAAIVRFGKHVRWGGRSPASGK